MTPVFEKFAWVVATKTRDHSDGRSTWRGYEVGNFSAYGDCVIEPPMVFLDQQDAIDWCRNLDSNADCMIIETQLR